MSTYASQITDVLVQNTGLPCAQDLTAFAGVTDGLISLFAQAEGANALADIVAVSGDLSVAANEFHYFVQGTSGLNEIVGPLQYSKLSKIIKKGYVAPVAQVTTLSSAPAIPAAGGTQTIKLVMLNDNDDQFSKTWTFEHIYAAGGTHNFDNLRDLINANAAIPITASGTTTLILTADTAGESFFVAVDNEFVGVTIVYTTPATYGSGTPSQIWQMERDAHKQKTHFYAPRTIYGPRDGVFAEFPTLKAIAAGQYDTYHFLYENDVNTAINSRMQGREVIVALDNNVIVETNWETLLATATGKYITL